MPQIEERLVKLPEVLAAVGMKKSAWYDGIKSGKYPKPIKRSSRDTVWRWTEIQKVISCAIAGGGLQ